ncbi:MAG: FAD-dependent oxidoreductase [Spirochaetales bacterium]
MTIYKNIDIFLSMLDHTNRYVIVGGVAAGATAAARIRRLEENAEIIVLERGSYVSFANCGLPYHISGDIEKRSKLILQTPEGFASRYRVTVKLHSEVIALQPDQKQITLASGETLSYDALILALGGSPVIPPIPGVNLPHVFKLWTIPDMDAINRYIKENKPQRAVVVGGGFIGLETAEAFLKRGLQVSIVEMLDRLMPNLDPLYGRKIQERFEQEGARVLVSERVTAIEEKEVRLADGTILPADLVLLSVGVRPNVQIAHQAGLTLGATGALEVDEYLRTSDPFIWAAGDMIEVMHQVSGKKVRIPLAGPANRQGRIAATNAVITLNPQMGLRPQPYKGSLGTSVVKILDATLAATGLSLEAAKKAGFDAREATILKTHHVTYYPGAEDLLLTLIYDKDSGRILGATAYGKQGVEKRIDAAAVAIYAGLTLEDLSALDFAYAPPYSAANDPLNLVAFVASNARSGYSPLVSAEDLEGVIGNSRNGFVEGKTVFLDVRTYGEYRKDHLAGAIHIPLDELRDRFDELSREKPLRIISTGGYEGHIASRQLLQKNFKDVANISGGWAALRLVPGIPREKEEV